MNKETIVKFGISVGAVVVGLALFNVVIGPILGRMLAPKISSVNA